MHWMNARRKKTAHKIMGKKKTKHTPNRMKKKTKIMRLYISSVIFCFFFSARCKRLDIHMEMLARCVWPQFLLTATICFSLLFCFYCWTTNWINDGTENIALQFSFSVSFTGFLFHFYLPVLHFIPFDLFTFFFSSSRSQF